MIGVPKYFFFLEGDFQFFGLESHMRPRQVLIHHEPRLCCLNGIHAGAMGTVNGFRPETVPPPHETTRWSNGRMKTGGGSDLEPAQHWLTGSSSSLPYTTELCGPSCEDFPAGHPSRYCSHTSTLNPKGVNR